MSRIEFEGILPPLTTPFSQDGKILFPQLDANLHAYADMPVSGFLILGSNGEAPHLSEEEKLQVVRSVCREAPSGRKLLAGVSSPSLQGALRWADRLSDLPLDALLVSLPAYYKNRMSHQALIDYFSGLAESSPIPLLLYNVPQYSGIALQARTAAALARHPRIIGMKDSSGDLNALQSILAAVDGQDFQILIGNAQVFGPALTLGIRAAILAVACARPTLPHSILLDHRQGLDTREKQARLHRLGVAVTSSFGVAGLKYAMDRSGLKGGFCRLPLLPLSGEEKAQIDEILRSLGAE